MSRLFFRIPAAVLMAASLAAAPRPSPDAGDGNPSCVSVEGRLDGHYEDQLRAITRPVVYENGILFTCEAGADDEVSLSGSFVDWNKHFAMHKNRYGVWYCFLPLEIPAGTYPYRFYINRLWVNDPQQPLVVPDQYGSRISALRLDRSLVQMKVSPRAMGANRYLFFLKDRGYTNVYWVGSRNHWDPYTDPMKRADGYWQITLTMTPDQVFYRFRVDGQDLLDPANPHIGSLKFGEKVSIVPLGDVYKNPPPKVAPPETKKRE